MGDSGPDLVIAAGATVELGGAGAGDRSDDVRLVRRTRRSRFLPRERTTEARSVVTAASSLGSATGAGLRFTAWHAPSLEEPELCALRTAQRLVVEDEAPDAAVGCQRSRLWLDLLGSEHSVDRRQQRIAIE